jgi:hypothetical protein
VTSVLRVVVNLLPYVADFLRVVGYFPRDVGYFPRDVGYLHQDVGCIRSGKKGLCAESINLVHAEPVHLLGGLQGGHGGVPIRAGYRRWLSQALDWEGPTGPLDHSSPS